MTETNPPESSSKRAVRHIILSRDFYAFVITLSVTWVLLLFHVGWGPFEDLNPGHVSYSELSNLKAVVPVYFQTFAIVVALLIASFALFVGSGTVGQLLQKVSQKDPELYRQTIRVVLFPTRIGLVAIVASLLLVVVPFEGGPFVFMFSLLTGLFIYLVAALWLMVDGLRNAIFAASKVQYGSG